MAEGYRDLFYRQVAEGYRDFDAMRDEIFSFTDSKRKDTFAVLFDITSGCTPSTDR